MFKSPNNSGLGSASDFEHFQRSLSAAHFAWKLEPHAPREFRGELTYRICEGVIFTDIYFDPVRATRGIGQIDKQSNDGIGLTLLLDGGVTFAQERRTVQPESGEMVLWSGLRPGLTEIDIPTRCLTIIFPRALVNQHIYHVDDLCGRKVGRCAVGSILASHCEALHKTIALVSPIDRGRLFSATLELLAACFRPDDVMSARTGYRHAQLRRIEDYIIGHLAEPSLNQQDVAHALGINTRSLSKVFESAGTKFCTWVRNERLARASKRLASCGVPRESITEIAFGLGFYDAAHFSRCFKQRYGVTPREFRLRGDQYSGSTPIEAARRSAGT